MVVVIKVVAHKRSATKGIVITRLIIEKIMKSMKGCFKSQFLYY